MLRDEGQNGCDDQRSSAPDTQPLVRGKSASKRKGRGQLPGGSHQEHAPSPAAHTEIGGQNDGDDRSPPAPNGRGQDDAADQTPVAPANPIVAELIELQKQRTFCIVSQSRCDRSVESFIARYLGFRGDLTEKERKALYAQAAAIRKGVEKNGGGQGKFDSQRGNAPAACVQIILLSASARIAWDKHRTSVVKRMEELARQLPVYPWAKAIKGFGDLGLAVIVAETGDLANYATKERVWKRLGLAVIDGERQQRKSGAEAAAAHGYSPRRRAEVWAQCADSMFRHQWAGDKDENGGNPKLTGLPVAIPAHAKGPYGAVYGVRKAHTALRDWTPSHRDNDARRIMTKALIEDLWKEWRRG